MYTCAGICAHALLRLHVQYLHQNRIVVYYCCFKSEVKEKHLWITKEKNGEGIGNLLWYSCLENLMDRGTWWAVVCRISESDMTEAT